METSLDITVVTIKLDTERKIVQSKKLHYNNREDVVTIRNRRSSTKEFRYFGKNCSYICTFH